MFPSNSSRLKKLKLYLSLFLFGLLGIISISGCGIEEEQLYSKDEAEKKFIRICNEEYDLDVSTKFVGNTFWIYVPYEKDIFQWKANRFAQTNKCATVYFKGEFSDGIFYFEYQIMPLLKSEEDKGYSFDITEESGQNLNYLSNTMFRVYFNAEQQPEFYVIVMADIVNGIEITRTVYNDDLKKIYASAISSEDSYKRIVNDTRGSLAIVNDRTGRHLDYKEIDFRQFLVDQIAQRVRIKFFGVDSELCRAPEEEILNIISYVVRTYEFQDYSKVVLKNLSTGDEIEISRWDLQEIKEF